MKDLAEQIWSTIKKWWWVIAGALVAILGWLLLAPRGKKPQSKQDLLKVPPETAVDSLRQVAVLEAEKATADALIAKAKRDTKVEVKRKELDRIKSEPDPVVRRKRLAAWATKNL